MRFIALRARFSGTFCELGKSVFERTISARVSGLTGDFSCLDVDFVYGMNVDEDRS